jgi:hypothetical protein
MRWKAGKAKGRKVFFFEKKNQKTFIYEVPNESNDFPCGRGQFAKVFCFFFSKKKCFLSTLWVCFPPLGRLSALRADSGLAVR